MYRHCNKCNTTKSISEFPINRGKKSGHDSLCKNCTREYKHIWRERNKERLQEKDKKYYQDHAEEIKAKVNEWNQTNKNHRAAYLREWRTNNIEKIQKSSQKFYDAYPWKQADYSAKRRAKQKSATIEEFTREKIYERDGGRCHICGNKVSKKKWHLDHLIPLSQGGEHSRKNVAVSCPLCNMRKNAIGPAQLRLLD